MKSLPMNINVRVSKDVGDKLVRFSIEQNLTVSQSVRAILGSFFIVNPSPSKQEKRSK